MKGEKRLIYVPILHTSYDMGSLASSMRQNYVKKFGEEKWREHVSVIDEMWEGIKKRITTLHLNFKKVKVYQDGLPLCGKERKIIFELAEKGSPNHQIIRWLIDQGAGLIGTEDPQLLVQEYSFMKKIIEANTVQEKEEWTKAYVSQEKALLQKRDEKIRDQISETLKEGETGILFMGLIHHVDELLSPEIKVSYLIHRLPFRRSFEMKMVA